MTSISVLAWRKVAPTCLLELEIDWGGAWDQFRGDAPDHSTPTGPLRYSMARVGPFLHPGIDCIVPSIRSVDEPLQPPPGGPPRFDPGWCLPWVRPVAGSSGKTGPTPPVPGWNLATLLGATL